jgi:hypothetical protein
MFSSTLRNALLAGVAGVALLAASANAGTVSYSLTKINDPIDGQNFTFDFNSVAKSDGIGTLTISGKGDFGGSGEFYTYSIEGGAGIEITPTITAHHGTHDKSFSDSFTFSAAQMAAWTADGMLSIFIDYPNKVSGSQPEDPFLMVGWSYAEYIPPPPPPQIQTQTSQSQGGGPSSIPEPGTLALFGLGIAGLGFARRRRLV